MNVRKFQKKPVTVRAMQFTGDDENYSEMVDFTDRLFQWSEAGNPVTPAEVYDRLHDTWIGVKIGDWIIEGTQGEFYPHDGPLFEHNYFEVTE